MNCLFLLVLLCCTNRRPECSCERGCRERDRERRDDGCKCGRSMEKREDGCKCGHSMESREDGCKCGRSMEQREADSKCERSMMRCDEDDRMHREREASCECRNRNEAVQPRFDERRRGYPFADMVPEMARTYSEHAGSCNCKK